MSIYYDKQVPGELWLRDLKNNVDSASNILSSVYLKYKNVNSTFFSYLISNQITRFDLFYDTFFIETPIGCIFEKFFIQSEEILPYNQINLFNPRKTTSIDYWFNENKNNVIFTEIHYFNDILKNPYEKYFEFILIVKAFDCTTGLTKTLVLDVIRLSYISSRNWDGVNFGIENPKITYNKDTKNYNISFILRNTAKELGLVSINLSDSDIPVVTEVNGFLPYFVQDTLNSGITAIRSLPSGIYDYILTQMGDVIQTQAPEELSFDYN